MANITKQQITDILNNRPEGTTPEGIISELRTKGHQLEGYQQAVPGEIVPQEQISQDPLQKMKETVRKQFGIDRPETKFLERAKLSFGGEKAEEQQQSIEEQLGLKGQFDVGDIADVLGDILPFVGGMIGGAVGAPAGGAGAIPGVALGVGAGEMAKRTIGRFAGVREEVSPTQEVVGVGTSIGSTYLGGKVLQKIVELPVVSKAITSLTQKLPTRLMQTFFKSSLRDYQLMQETQAMAKLQTENPELFAKFIKEGLARINKETGKVEINPDLALEALRRGFGTGKTGYSLEKMAQYSFIQKQNFEIAAREAVRGKKGLVDIGQDKKVSEAMLRDVYDTLKEEGYGKITPLMNRVQQTLTKLKKYKDSNIDAELALDVRRLIDGLRNSSSFRGSVKLAPKQSGFKATADDIRHTLADNVPELKNIMNEYRFHINAFDDLSEEGFKRGKAKIVGMADAFLGGTSMSYTTGGMQPGGSLGLMAIFRALQSPTVLSAMSQGLYKTPQTIQKLFPAMLSAFGAQDDPFGLREKLMSSTQIEE